MKKKLLSALLAALLVLSMIPFAFAGTATATEPGNVAYLTDGGDDDTAALNDASAPFGTFKAAYNALCPAGGTIKIVDVYGGIADVTTANIAGLNTHYGTITITGDEATDYWYLPALSSNDAANWVKLAGPVVIENIHLYAPNQTYILANCAKLTMGEGIVVEETLGTSLAGKNGTKISVMGSTMNGGEFMDTWVTIKSGSYRAVSGGSRVTSAFTTAKSLLGTAYLFLEGGNIANVISTNWGVATSGAGLSYGGQAYVYVDGATVSKIYIGGQNSNSAAMRDSFLIYTSGYIAEIVSGRTLSRPYCFYGGDVTSTYGNTQITATTSNAFSCGGKATKVTYLSPLRTLPLRSGTDEVVYVDQSLNVATNSGHAPEDGAFNLAIAIALLTRTGGTIVLCGDSQTLNSDFNTNAYRFNEPYHAAPITITGQNADGSTKLTASAPVAATRDHNSYTYARNTGLDLYNLCGDTTFENVTINFAKHGANIAANFHNLTIGDNVSTAKTVRLAGGYVTQEPSVNRPYAAEQADGSFKSTTAHSFYEPYALWSDADTHITLSASNTGIWWISGFSRIEGGVLPMEGYNVVFPGTAFVTVGGGTVNSLYPATVSKRGATGANAEIAINGGLVKNLYDGGFEAEMGAIAGNLNITVGENAKVENYVNTTSAPASFTMKVNSTYSSYLIAKNTYTQANVTTDITADTYRDSIDAVLGFGLKDNGADGVKIRYGAKLKDYIVDDPDFTVKEFGVLIKNANNATALEWFDSDAQLTYQNKVAKKIAYKAGTEMNYYDYDPANGNDVQFYTTLTGISEARYETEYVFRAYMVVTVNGVDQVVYGAESADSAYTIAQRLTSSNETAAKVIDAVENAGA